MLTKLTQLRKMTKDLTSLEIQKAIENLMKILDDKQAEEKSIIDKVQEKEAVRVRILEELESNKLPIPNELKKPITVEDVLPRKRKKKAID